MTAPLMKRESYEEKETGIDSSPVVSYIVVHVLRLRSNKQYLNVCSNVREVDYCEEEDHGVLPQRPYCRSPW